MCATARARNAKNLFLTLEKCALSVVSLQGQVRLEFGFNLDIRVMKANKKDEIKNFVRATARTHARVTCKQLVQNHIFS